MIATGCGVGSGSGETPPGLEMPATGTGGAGNAAAGDPPCSDGSCAAEQCGPGSMLCGSSCVRSMEGVMPCGIDPQNTGGSAGGGGTGNAPGGEDPPVNTGGTGGSATPDVTGAACGSGPGEGRLMECLDRGVIAVPAEGGLFISWRLFGTDAPDTSFRLYRQNAAGAPQLVCTTGPAQGTWCRDTAGTAGSSYFVRPLRGETEGPPSGSRPAQAQDHLRIPLRAASPDAYVHLAWVGDLNGDGEYDVVVDRLSANAPLVDAYSQAGEFLWRLDTGPLGANQNNIEGGASTLSNGHWDGLTVYDFDGDGASDVAIKTANGFVFGDGTVLSHDNDQDQFVSIVDGLTGAEVARAPLPDQFESDGPLQCHFGVGYFDGVHPSVVTKCKNRIGNGGFNLVGAAYDFDGASLTRRWTFTRNINAGGADYHQIRVLDVDGDGKDELADGGYVIDDDGSVLYSLGEDGVVHGDRFHITDMDPARPGLEGWGIQQDNANGLETYYYDAATGEMLRTYRNPNGAGADMGRGTVADLFPDNPGYEYWSFNGMYSAATGALLVAEQNQNVPWPNFAMQWDGDVGGELLDNNRVGDWNLQARSRNTYSWRRSFEGLVQARGAIPFYGDIWGDWREEALLETADHAELRIYTTTFETDVRLYTLVHNPQYRNSLTVHGYKQSHLVDYYLGFGMSPPPAPKIRLVNRP